MKNCDHLFDLVNPGINTPSYAKCIYCGQIGDNPIRIEHLAISEITLNTNLKIFMHPWPSGRFNCAGKYIFDDPANAAFFGHDLNHK